MVFRVQRADGRYLRAAAPALGFIWTQNIADAATFKTEKDAEKATAACKDGKVISSNLPRQS